MDPNMMVYRMLPNTSCSSACTFFWTSGWEPMRCKAQFMEAAVVSCPCWRYHKRLVSGTSLSTSDLTWCILHPPQTWRCPLPPECPHDPVHHQHHLLFLTACPRRPFSFSAHGLTHCQILPSRTLLSLWSPSKHKRHERLENTLRFYTESIHQLYIFPSKGLLFWLQAVGVFKKKKKRSTKPCFCNVFIIFIFILYVMNELFIFIIWERITSMIYECIICSLTTLHLKGSEFTSYTHHPVY